MNLATDQAQNHASPENLPVGASLFHGEYEITKFVNSGGWGKAYLAQNSLHQTVLVKECFPEAFCVRQGKNVAPRLGKFTKLHSVAVNDFAREARQLATIRHPNIVDVHQVFKENDTAYIVMEYIKGRELVDVVDNQGPLPSRQAESLAHKLLSAIEKVHSQDMLHRDISPDNVLLRDGSDDPVLIDFGAARAHVSDTSRALTALLVVKNGYSPQEFYVAGTEQAPASDLYSLGATLYFTVTGKVPPDAQTRLSSIVETGDDPCEKLAGNVKGYSESFLEGIDRAMEPRMADRFQSASEWLAYLDSGSNVRHLNTGKPAPAPTAEAPVTEPQEIKPVSTPPASDAEIESAVKTTLAETQRPAPQKPAPASEAEPRKKSMVPLLALAAGGVLAVGGFFVMNGKGSDTDVSEPAVIAAAPTVSGGTDTRPATVVPPAAEPAPEPDTAVVETAPATPPVTTPPAAQDEVVVAPSAPTDAAPSVTVSAPESPSVAPVGTTEQPERVVEAPVTDALAPVVAAPSVDSAPAEDSAPQPVVQDQGGAPLSLDEQIIGQEWALEFPYSMFPRLDGRGERVISVRALQDGADPESGLTPGTEILKVNGSSVNSPIEIMDAIRFGDDHVARLTLQVRQENTPVASTRFVDFYEKGQIIFANGAEIIVSYRDGAWTGHVKAVPDGQSDLRVGDTLVGASDAEWLVHAVQDAIENGEAAITLRAIRDGAESDIVMPLLTAPR